MRGRRLSGKDAAGSGIDHNKASLIVRDHSVATSQLALRFERASPGEETPGTVRSHHLCWGIWLW